MKVVSIKCGPPSGLPSSPSFDLQATESKPMICINAPAMKYQPAQLPDLVWPKIFKFLEYDDLLNLVSIFDQLKTLMSIYVQSKTVVINQDKANYALSAFSSRFLISKSPLRFRMSGHLHLAIKKLVLHNPFRLFNLSGLPNLTDLIIVSTTNFKCPNSVHFGFMNLDRFKLDVCHNQEFGIVLEAPKLCCFHCHNNLKHFQIVHPRSIKELICPRIEPIIEQMVNLVTLKCYDFDITDPNDLFARLKRLKHFGFFNYLCDQDSANDYLQSLLTANPNLGIFFKRIDINSGVLEEEILGDTTDDCLDDADLWIADFVEAIDDHLNHSTLKVENFDSLTVALIQKLTRLKSLHVLGEITDDAKWIELLKLPKLVNFTIGAALSEEQLALISEHCPSVTCLKIDSFEGGDWVLRLKYLKEFRTDVLFDFELFKKMINELHYLKLVSLSESHEVRIENAVVECVSGNHLVLREPISVFLQTVQLINLWGDLFYFELLPPAYPNRNEETEDEE